MNRSITVTILMGALWTAALVGSPLRADELDDPLPSLVVHFNQNELLHTSGVELVYQRLHNAAREVCQTYFSKDLALQWRFRHCIDLSLARAIVQIDDQALSSYYEREVGKSPTLADAGRARSLLPSTLTPRAVHPIRANDAEGADDLVHYRP